MYSGFDYGIRLDLRHCSCGAHAVAGAEKGRARYRISAGADSRGDFTFAGVQRGRKCGAAFFRSALAVRLGFGAVSAGVQGSRRGGHVVRHVNMSLQDWVLAAFLLILGSLAFVAIGLVLTLLPSSQLMSVAGNLLYMGLAVMGGLWMPISVFPEWMQAIGKCLPTYQLMELIKTFLNKGQVNVFASLYLTLFTLVLFVLVIFYRRHSEVRS